MNARLTALPGGRDLHPHAAHIVSPARRKFARDLTAATTNIARSHEDNIRPSHPVYEVLPGVVLFDHANELDVPALPWKVRDALRIVLRSIATPQSETRPNVVMAAALVEQHVRVLPDDAPAGGIDRPVTL